MLGRYISASTLGALKWEPAILNKSDVVECVKSLVTESLLIMYIGYDLFHITKLWVRLITSAVASLVCFQQESRYRRQQVVG